MMLPARRRARRTAVLVGLAGLLAAGCAAGREERPTAAPPPPLAAPPPAAPSPAPLTVTPARLDAYVLAVQNIRAAHPRFLQEGLSEAQVREEMRAAVGRAGLTLEEFRNIHRQVEADPALRAEVRSRLAAAGSTPPGATGTGAPGGGRPTGPAGTSPPGPAPAPTSAPPPNPGPY